MQEVAWASLRLVVASNSEPFPAPPARNPPKIRTSGIAWGHPERGRRRNIMRKNLAKTGRNKSIGSITFYAAMSLMDGNRNIQRTKGYEMLRQAAYARQRELAEGTTGKKRDS